MDCLKLQFDHGCQLISACMLLLVRSVCSHCTEAWGTVITPAGVLDEHYVKDIHENFLGHFERSNVASSNSLSAGNAATADNSYFFT